MNVEQDPISLLSQIIEEEYERCCEEDDCRFSPKLEKIIVEFYDHKQKFGGPYGCFGHYWIDKTKTEMLSGEKVLEILKRNLNRQ